MFDETKAKVWLFIQQWMKNINWRKCIQSNSPNISKEIRKLNGYFVKIYRPHSKDILTAWNCTAQI